MIVSNVDTITLAKGLASGSPIGAMMAKKELRGAFSAGIHGSTFGGGILAVTAGLATLEMLLGGMLTGTSYRAWEICIAAFNRLTSALFYRTKYKGTWSLNWY